MSKQIRICDWSFAPGQSLHESFCPWVHEGLAVLGIFVLGGVHCDGRDVHVVT